MPRDTFSSDLNKLKLDLLDFGTVVQQTIGRGVDALRLRDQTLAHSIIEHDEEINQTRYQIEERAYEMLATQQPMAVDLRDIISILLIAIELERIADHAKNLAEIAIYMGTEPLLKPLIDIPRMSDECQQMLGQALDAFARKDAELAEHVANSDDEIDSLYKQVFRELMTYIVEDPRTVTRAMNLLFAAHNLERIGDCITNIAERVIYSVTGRLEEINVQRPV